MRRLPNGLHFSVCGLSSRFSVTLERFIQLNKGQITGSLDGLGADAHQFGDLLLRKAVPMLHYYALAFPLF